MGLLLAIAAAWGLIQVTFGQTVYPLRTLETTLDWTVNLVAFGSLIRDRYNIGQVFTLFIITFAAAETGLGLAIVLMIFRQRGTADIDEQRQLAEPLRGPEDETEPGPQPGWYAYSPLQATEADR